MKLTKRQLRKIIKEELSSFLGEDMDEELMQVMSVALDQELDPGAPAQAYLRAAMRGRGQVRAMVRGYIQQHGKEKLLAAMEAEMAKHSQLY